MEQSKFFKLNALDLGKSLLVAFFTSFVTVLYTSLESGHLPNLATLKVAAITGLTGAVGYLVKNVFTNSEGKIAAKEQPKE